MPAPPPTDVGSVEGKSRRKNCDGRRRDTSTEGASDLHATLTPYPLQGPRQTWKSYERTCADHSRDSGKRFQSPHNLKDQLPCKDAGFKTHDYRGENKATEEGRSTLWELVGEDKKKEKRGSLGTIIPEGLHMRFPVSHLNTHANSNLSWGLGSTNKRGAITLASFWKTQIPWKFPPENNHESKENCRSVL